LMTVTRLIRLILRHHTMILHGVVIHRRTCAALSGPERKKERKKNKID